MPALRRRARRRTHVRAVPGRTLAHVLPDGGVLLDLVGRRHRLLHLPADRLVWNAWPAPGRVVVGVWLADAPDRPFLLRLRPDEVARLPPDRHQ